ncbi:hypothetical protein SteCoe_35595 [Stentor coeruleus]|uniref:Uncharacterized protein n=1 Tax=Stentor coeruleus TaxID=5963 RepID=A0A1R2AS02_9CILI|nr:hypothetical protein SteCoe_35595 [Stentor coeruleus]
MDNPEDSPQEIGVQADLNILTGYVKKIRFTRLHGSELHSAKMDLERKQYASAKLLVDIQALEAEKIIRKIDSTKRYERKLLSDQILIQKRSNSNEFYQSPKKRYGSVIKLIETPVIREVRAMSNRKILGKRKEALRANLVNSPYAELSTILLKKPPIIRQKKSQDYRRFNKSPKFKPFAKDSIYKTHDSSPKKTTKLDLTVSNSNISSRNRFHVKLTS